MPLKYWLIPLIYLNQIIQLKIVGRRKIFGFCLIRLKIMKSPLGSRPGPQAKDEEWETWRDVLIRLYLEDNLKLKEIVKIMAEEYKFVVR